MSTSLLDVKYDCCINPEIAGATDSSFLLPVFSTRIARKIEVPLASEYARQWHTTSHLSVTGC